MSKTGSQGDTYTRWSGTQLRREAQAGEKEGLGDTGTLGLAQAAPAGQEEESCQAGALSMTLKGRKGGKILEIQLKRSREVRRKPGK